MKKDFRVNMGCPPPSVAQTSMMEQNAHAQFIFKATLFRENEISVGRSDSIPQRPDT
jgi:hypothetical protein